MPLNCCSRVNLGLQKWNPEMVRYLWTCLFARFLLLEYPGKYRFRVFQRENPPVLHVDSAHDFYSNLNLLLKRFCFGAQEVEIGLIAESAITTTASGFNQNSSFNEPGYGFGSSGLCRFEQPHGFGHRDNRMSRQ
jgi:hypothetical protein